ncbi:ABC transporter substrate-binding protein [Pikeienuella sp. HZG-20]|uniref:ABC transporter substrate-binding protein n=1 Tax=Paludibacillus litoralis TaxID=3133267 RepID=UPI0030EE6057
MSLNRLTTFLGSAAIAAASFAAVAPAHAEAKEPLRIGLLLSMSGPAAPFGIPERDVIEILAKKMNDEGGVDGRMIELFMYDDATNPTEAARGATKLIQKDNVVAIVGSTTGSGTLAAGPVMMRYEVPIVAPNATLAVTSPENSFFPWVFRSLTGDLTNTRVLLERAIEDGATKVGLFYQEDAYGKNTADFLQELAKEKGVTIVESAAAPLKSLDLTSQASKIRNADPEVVLIQASAPALGAAFVRAARQVGLDAPMWAPLGLGQKSFVDNSGEAGNGIRLTLVANWDDPSPKMQTLGDILTAAGKPPQGFGEVIGSNAFLAIVEASKSISGEITGKAMRDALENLCGVETYSAGTLCYSPDDHDGWSHDLVQTGIIQDGKFVTTSR